MAASLETISDLGIRSRIRDADLLPRGTLVGAERAALDASRTVTVANPATGEHLGTLLRPSAADLRLAIEAAQSAWPRWRAMTPDGRGAILRAWATLMRAAREDLALIVTLEQGKPLNEALGEIEYAAGFLDWFAEEGRRSYGDVIPSHLPGRRLFTVREPIGVTAAITPWNFPCAMITRKAGAALAAGCPMIVRPADETPFSALALATLAERARMPPGVFTVIVGEAVEFAATLAASETVRALSFTGSTEVGRSLLRRCADGVKRVALELGGHAPFIVLEDADFALAVELAMQAKFQTSGQDCLAANRILVARPLYARFVEEFVRRARVLRVGNGLDPGVQIGPLISTRAVARCQSQVDDAVARGASLRCGGGVHDAGARFYSPTVLAGVTRDMRVWREETFGPVAAISPFDSDGEAVAMANDTIYGLAAYVCTRDLVRGLGMGERLEFGMVALNTARFTGPPVPFGGMKQSGLGREGSRHGLDDYTEIKYVCAAVGSTVEGEPG